MPWFTIPDRVSLGSLHLLPYHRGASPSDGDEQANIDAVLEPYTVHGGRPIESATILTLGDRGIVDDFADSGMDDLFRFGELIAFAGLSARQFFRQLRYTGRDDFRLLVQSFEDPRRGALVQTRRRDGATNLHYSRGNYRVPCPPHVGAAARDLDLPLLAGLMDSQEEEDWPRVFQAVLLFNESNTDREYMPDAAEMVLCFAALEQLLDIQAKPSALAGRFEEIWEPSEPLDKEEWTLPTAHASQRARLASAPSLRYAWIEDMGIARGSLAHGHEPGAFPSIWSPQEHLLLAAFVFPRLIKLHLAHRGRYKMTERDLSEIDALEDLLNARHCDAPPEGESHPWSDSLSQAELRRWIGRTDEDAGTGGDAAVSAS